MGCETLLWKEGRGRKGGTEGGKEERKNERKKKKEEKIHPPSMQPAHSEVIHGLIQANPREVGGGRTGKGGRRQEACERTLSPFLVSAS